LSAVVVNTLHILDDLPSTSSSQQQQQQLSLYDSELLDKMYQRQIKGPYRLLQAISENLFQFDQQHRIVFLSPSISSIASDHQQLTARSLIEELWREAYESWLEQLVRLSSRTSSTTKMLVSSIISYDKQQSELEFELEQGEEEGLRQSKRKGRKAEVMIASWKQLLVNHDPSFLTSSASASASLPARAILHALCGNKPRVRYPIG
jgi:hypothetical protein